FPMGLGWVLKQGFLYSQEVPLGTAASALHRRDKVDLSDAHRGEDEFYPVPNSNIYCRKCPAGTYVAEHCKEQNGFSKCLPCKDNEYIKYPNGLLMCFDCRTCREDEVQLSPCRAVQDTQCACRNGTFCSPEHPCEMCQKCRPRCPNGEVELAPCTSSSDRRCGPPTTTHSLSSTCGAAVGGGMGLSCCWDLQHLPTCSVLSLSSHLDRDHRGGNLLGPKGCAGGEPALQALPCPLSFPLFPLPGLRNSFYTFAQKVPHDHWKRFGRALSLLENDIDLAKKEEGMEMLIEMLKKWQERGTINASVNTLLDTLHQINLGGVAEDIAFELVKEGSFQYEVS
uniref:Uncharacterized protein n=1 Tax=Melopsittacus undulatus TaxID=13146 RepID=A0A8V5H1C6_MELUD